MVEYPKSKPKGCYVYRILAGRYVYVGKGKTRKGERQRYHDHFCYRCTNPFLRRVLAKAKHVVVTIVEDRFLSHETAFDCETVEVAKARKSRRLRVMNLTDGGDGFDSETARRAGKIGGPATRAAALRFPEVFIRNGRRWAKAVFAKLTPEQRSANGRAGGLVGGRVRAASFGRWSVESGHWARVRKIGAQVGNLVRWQGLTREEARRKLGLPPARGLSYTQRKARRERSRNRA